MCKLRHMTDTMRARIRKVQADTGSSDPHEIAAKLISELTEDELVAAVAAFVRINMNAERRGTYTAVPQASAKVGAVQSWYEKLLDQSVDVSGDQGQWKRLADCTRDDLLQIAKYRRDVAARNLATAEKYEALAKGMKANQTVADIKPEKVREAFDQ